MPEKHRTIGNRLYFITSNLFMAITLTVTPAPTLASEVELFIDRVGGRNVLEQQMTPAVEDYTFMGSLAANREKFQPLAQVEFTHCRALRLVCIAPALAALNVELLENQSQTFFQDYLKPKWGRLEYHEKGCPVMHEISSMIAISGRLKQMEVNGRDYEARLITKRATLVISAFGGIYNNLDTPECRELFVSKPYLAQAYLDQAARLFLMLKDENRVEWLDLYSHSSLSRIRQELSMSLESLKPPTKGGRNSSAKNTAKAKSKLPDKPQNPD